MDYSIIFEKLREIGITKTKLREAVGFSTVTLAKISAGEPISLEILGKICNYLKIDIDLILNKEKDSSNKKWDFIKNGENYTTVLWYRVSDNNELMYLYGYSVKSIEKVDERDNWDVEFSKSYNVVQFKQTISGKKLLSLIEHITLNESLSNYFNENKYKVNKKMEINKLDIKLLESKIMTFDNKQFSKRMLYPKSFDHNVKESEQMQHSFSESVCISYGMETINKLNYPVKKHDLQFYRQFFKDIVGLYDSDTDILKIGNFEIFDFIGKDYYETKPDIKNKKICILFRGMKMKLKNIDNSLKIIFRGIYNNAEVINRFYDIYTSDIDYNLNIDLPEEIDSYEVKIYENKNDDLMLIGYEKEFIIKRINISLNVENENINIRSKNNRKYKFTNYSTEHIIIGDDKSYDRLRSIISMSNINDNHELNDFYYERNDSESKDNCYEWVKENIMSFNPSEIWVFDRYLNEKFLNVLLKIIDRTNVSIGLVTAMATKKSVGKDGLERIENLEKLIKECNNKSNFHLKLYKADKEKFHDRFLFIKKQNEILCFNLSNSFDDESENYGTYICKVSNKNAEYIWKKYSQLVNVKNLMNSSVNNENLDLDPVANKIALKSKYCFDSYEDIKRFILDGRKIEVKELLSMLDFNEPTNNNTREYITRHNYDEDDIESIYEFFTYLYHNSYGYEYSMETIMFEKLLYSDTDAYLKLFNETKKNKKAFDRLLLLTARIIKFPKVENPKFYIDKLLKLGMYEIDILCYSFVIYNIDNDFVYDYDKSADIDIIINSLPKCKNDEIIYEVFKNACLVYVSKINRSRSHKIDDKGVDANIVIYKNTIISLVELLASIIQMKNIRLNLSICKKMLLRLFEINCEITSEGIILSLYNKNVIDHELLYEICQFFVFERTGITKYKTNNNFFTENSNRELFNIMMLILNSEADICNEILSDCMNYQNKVVTLLNDYFLKERNPELWRTNINSLFYLEFCKCFVEEYMPDVYAKYIDVNKSAKINRAVKDIEKHYETYLKKYCEIYESLKNNFEGRIDEK